jgi:hypothetical protein
MRLSAKLQENQAFEAQESHVVLSGFVSSAMESGIEAVVATRGTGTLRKSAEHFPGFGRFVSESTARALSGNFHGESAHSAALADMRHAALPTTQVMLPNGKLFNTRMLGKSTTKGHKGSNNNLDIPIQAGSDENTTGKHPNSLLYPCTNSLKQPGEREHTTPSDVI